MLVHWFNDEYQLKSTKLINDYQFKSIKLINKNQDRFLKNYVNYTIFC